ncbi:MAG: hypothetical protein C4527_07695 [Candidatus Omnitrophota bacterium]|jgi:hypothetical protein|nr:MAG: hypothetical protein C4527_07695 [Candidatus Omnitrophota bacterium]
MADHLKGFLIYSDTDHDAVSKISDFLRKLGWDSSLEAINRFHSVNSEPSGVFVFCLSGNSDNHTIGEHVRRLQNKGNPVIIPLRLHECHVPMVFDNLVICDWFLPKERHRLLKAIGVSLSKEFFVDIPLRPIDMKPLRLIRIPAGSFMMGSWTEETKIKKEIMHKVTISHDFYMGEYPVTNGQWASIMDAEGLPNHYNSDAPVTKVNWKDCMRFCKKIGEFCIGEVRLPSEAEWEYACKAGSCTRYFWGDDPSGITDYARIEKTVPQNVASRKPNRFGLYDMIGNVWEWCMDYYLDYRTHDQTDPIYTDRIPKNKNRVIRGGSIHSTRDAFRSAARGTFLTSGRREDIGFRMVMGLE